MACSVVFDGVVVSGASQVEDTQEEAEGKAGYFDIYGAGVSAHIGSIYISSVVIA